MKNDVKVYFNSHKKLWSIKIKNKPVIHKKEIYLKNISFKVYEKGRMKVLKEKRKNVHAFVCGEVTSKFKADNMKKAYYNPYKTETFVSGEIPVFTAQRAALKIVDCKPVVSFE